MSHDTYVKRDLFMSKETYLCQKRPMFRKRATIYVNRDKYM